MGQAKAGELAQIIQILMLLYSCNKKSQNETFSLLNNIK